MKQPKFLTLLQTLSPETFQRFRRYLLFASPRSVQYPPVMELLANLHPHYSLYKDNLPAQVEAILLAHGAEKMDNKRRGNFFSRLYAELKDFLALEQLLQDKGQLQVFTLLALREQGLAELYNEALEEAIEQLSQQVELGTDYNHTLLRVYHEAYYNSLNNKLLSEDYGLRFLRGAQEQLQLFFTKLDLKYQIEERNRIRIVRNPTEISGEMIAPEQGSSPDDSLLQLYRLVSAQQTDPYDEERYQALAQLYQQELPRLGGEDRNTLFRYLSNASAAILRNRLSKETLRFAFELADLGWRYNLLNVLGGYSPMSFLNFVEIAVAVQELDWLERFINSSILHVPAMQREDVKAIALANLAVGRGDYSIAIDCLINTKISDPQLELRVRMLYCKIYYFLEATEALLSMLKSFDTFLRRFKTFQPEIVRGYLNFLKLLRLIAIPQTADFDKLNSSLSSVSPLYGRFWLMQQVSAKK